MIGGGALIVYFRSTLGDANSHHRLADLSPSAPVASLILFRFWPLPGPPLMTFPERCLVSGGIGVLVGAGLHVVALIGGPSWIEFGGAPPSVVQSARQGTWLAPTGALGIAALLTVWALYAFSGAGRIRPLPMLKTVLGGVALIFVIRGVIIIPFLSRANWASPIEIFAVAASVFVFVLGAAYAVGFWSVWCSQSAATSLPGGETNVG